MKELYYCNPFLDKSCRKSNCYIIDGPCHMTFKRECALTDKDGEPLKAPDINSAYNDTPPSTSEKWKRFGNGEGNHLYTRGKFTKKGYRLVTSQQEVT